jgi:hypothetical protein
VCGHVGGDAAFHPPDAAEQAALHQQSAPAPQAAAP